MTGYKEVNQTKLSKSDKAPITRAVDPYNPYESNVGRAMLNAQGLSLTGYVEVNPTTFCKSDKASTVRAIDQYNPYESNVGRATPAVDL